MEIGELRKRIESQISHGNNMAMDAEEDGDDHAEEAWNGYVRALRWVLSEIDLPIQEMFEKNYTPTKSEIVYGQSLDGMAKELLEDSK